MRESWRGVRRVPRTRVGVMIAATMVLAAVAAAVVAAGARADARPEVLTAGNPSGIVFAHGQAGNGARGQKSPNLIWHNGPVMRSGAAVKPIFWGTSWGTDAGDKVSGINTFYGGVGGSNYLGTTTEYTDGSGHVSSAVAYSGYLFDGTAAPSHAPSTSDVLAVVAANISSPQTNGYYPVYSDQPRGHANYCAWHSWGYVGSTLVQFAFFFKLDGDPGCDPGSNVSGESQGLQALANVSGHELSEALTDPHGDAWYDQSGAENADKCAWTFGHNYVTLKNGSKWRIQGNWSNAAYNTSSGYDGAGCIDGG